MTLAFASAERAAAARRIALVIGNDAYQELTALQKAAADATDTAKVLEAKGFDDVILKTNLTRLEMDIAVAEFLDAVAQGDTALFFYSGHGWSDGAQNFLVGVDAPKQASEAVLSRISIPLQNGANGILDALRQRGAGLKVAIIDACRDNPFTSTVAGRSIGTGRGLSRVDPPQGTFVVFSAGTGQTALDRLSDDDHERNSVFTRTFLPYLRNGIWLNEAVKAVQTSVKEIAYPHPQSPAYYDQVTGRACLFANCRNIDAPAPGGDVCAAAEAHYQEAKEIGTRAALVDHVNRFGSCEFAGLAEQRIEIIDRAPPLDGARVADAPAETDAAQCEELVADKASDDVDTATAIATCQRALADTPDDDKLTFLLGRASEAAEDYDAALKHYTAAGERGHGDALFAIGSLYYRGKGVAKDQAEAAKWFRKSAEQGSAHAQATLGRLYFYGAGVPEDKAESVKWFKLAAEQGRADAQFNVGLSYYRGQGVERDAQESAKWFRMAAEQRDVKARNNLAIMYLTGDGVEKDDKEAVKWFRLAAGQNDADANWALGGMYIGGVGGLNKDLERAAYHFLRALALESTDARHELIEKQAAGLPAKLRQEIQKALRSEGIYSGAIDGAFGPGTKAALEEYAARS